VSRRVAVALLVGALVVLAFVTSAARATPGDHFNAAITPAAVQPSASGGYAVAIANLGSSNDAANNAHVTIPSGFLVDPTSLAAATTSSGSCSATAWTVTLVASTIDAVAPPNPDGDLCPGGTLILNLTAASPSQEGDYEWPTSLFSDSNAFALQGQQPSVTVDGTPPSPPTLTATPPDPSNSADATFGFTDADSTATFDCRLDGGSFSSCASPLTYTGLGEVAHTFSIKAVDPAGNESTVTSYSWTVDLTAPPPPTITSAPPNVTASTSATFAFTDDDGGATFRCRLDDDAFSSCTSPITYSGLAAGTHTFRVGARDAAGNLSTVTSYAWTIDLTNPVVTIDPASEPHDPTNQTSANFMFASNKGGITFQCRLDGGAFSSCSSPKGYSNLADGRHTFGVKATDSLGNEGLETIYSWTVDTVPPVTTITSGPAAQASTSSATFTFASNEGPPTFACSLDGGAFGSCASPKSYTGLADGTHVFQVRATDSAGNTDPTPATYSWRVLTQTPPDTTPPGTVQELTRSVGYRLLRLSWSLPADADFDHVEVTRSRSAKGAARAVVYQGNGTGYTDKRFQNGTYYRYEIQAFDQAGNASLGVRVVVPPSALLRSPRDGAVVKTPPLLRWAGVPRATYYNVQVYSGSRKLLSRWPAKARLKLQRSWVYQGHRYRLKKGVYRWWVWPAFGPRSKSNYGRLLGTGTFVVR
jgi:hypothetical protein